MAAFPIINLQPDIKYAFHDNYAIMKMVKRLIWYADFGGYYDSPFQLSYYHAVDWACEIVRWNEQASQISAEIRRLSTGKLSIE